MQMPTTPTAQDAPEIDLDATVDTERYPLHAPDSSRYREAVAEVRAALGDTGCSVVRGFLRPETVERLQNEAVDLVPKANVNNHRTNPYSSEPDPTLPDDHPVNWMMERTNAFVPKVDIPLESHLRRLYHAPAFQRFVADCLAEPEIHEYADPYAALVLNVLHPGCQHPWHYDTNEFIVSTLVQASEEGGVFEYCPNIRSPEGEDYDRVGRVLRDEDRAEVQQLRLRAGDLQLFKGRFALHRVTRVTGDSPRLTGIFAYAKEPGVIGKVERTRKLFGRVSDAHYAAAGQRRGDDLID